MTISDPIKHIEIWEGYQVVNLTQFALEVDDSTVSDQIVADFILSKQFSFDCLLDCVKAEPNKTYLRQAFYIDKIQVTDFKKTDKQGVSEFLSDFLNEPDWGDDRNDFVKLRDRYFEVYSEWENKEFYILSTNWFDKEDKRVVDPESWIYTYYFLIISIDRPSNILTFTEWAYD